MTRFKKNRRIFFWVSNHFEWINSPISNDEWIFKFKESNYGNIDKDRLCEVISLEKESLNHDPNDTVNLNKISVLREPLKLKELAQYLEYKY